MSRMPERRPSIQISPVLTGAPAPEQGCRILTLPVETVSQFDTMETRFFSEGDELSRLPVAPDGFMAGFDEPSSVFVRRARLGRHTFWLASVAATLAICATVVLWNLRHDARASVLSAPVLEPALPLAVPQPAATLPTPPSPIPTPAADTSILLPSLAAAGADPIAHGDEVSETLVACRQAYNRHRTKDVVLACARAFERDGESAEIAVMMAKTEFDRGHSRQALDWASKAIALDENRADAYVFLGGAEQAAGHAAVAKTAYKRYLQLAPQGRYAADLRAVLGSL